MLWTVLDQVPHFQVPKYTPSFNKATPTAIRDTFSWFHDVQWCSQDESQGSYRIDYLLSHYIALGVLPVQLWQLQQFCISKHH